MITAAHGRMPVPAPATLELLKGFPIQQGGPPFERTTPTGAAILAAMARPAPPDLRMVPLRVGIGAGSKDPPEVPNILRAVLADTDQQTPGEGAAPWLVETIECAEANLDDSNPEWIGYLAERLFSEGALDVALLSAQMKKHRPGTLLQVLYRPESRPRILRLLFSETTTLGVRYHQLERAALPRHAKNVSTPWGEVLGKVAQYGDKAGFSPEYESCARLARAHGVPLRQVYQAAQTAFHDE